MVGWGVLWGTVTPHASCLAILLSRDHQVIRAIGKQTHWDLFTQMSFMTIKTALVRSHSKKKSDSLSTVSVHSKRKHLYQSSNLSSTWEGSQ